VIPVANVFRVIALKDGKPHRVIVGDTAQDNCHLGKDDIGWKPDDDAGEAAANALLIAAAPAMLDALRRIIRCHDEGCDEQWGKLIDIGRTAVANATVPVPCPP
jgi:hypothetical protein